MRREEIETAIEKGESVWLVDEEENKIEELHFYKNNMYNFDKNDLFINKYWIYEFRKLFKTKAEAEHYLHHANITRTETLPFLTWEEFLENKNFEFFDKNGILTWLYINTSKTSESIHLNNRFEKLNDWNLTEENFYKAYDECVRLFRGNNENIKHR